MTERDDEVRAVAAEIERYLACHPDAADRPEGIRGWWLSPPLRAEPLDVVVAALEALRARGVVRRTQLDGVGPLYAAARSEKRHEGDR
jgi:hypothetical protein